MGIKQRPYYNQYRYMRSVIHTESMSQHKFLKSPELEWNNYWEFEDFVVKRLGPRPSLNHVLTRRRYDQGWHRDNIYWGLPSQRSRDYYAQTMNTGLKYRGRAVSIRDYCELKKLNYHTFINLRRQGKDNKTCERGSRRG